MGSDLGFGLGSGMEKFGSGIRNKHSGSATQGMKLGQAVKHGVLAGCERICGFKKDDGGQEALVGQVSRRIPFILL